MGGKQKVVLRVPVLDAKSKSRALQTVVRVPGLSSVSVEGADKNLVVVIGEGIDSVGLTKSLRKKLGDAELVTVAPVEEKKPDDKEKKPDNKEIPPWSYGPGRVIYVLEPFPHPCNPDPCSIL
ncbi:hypothetical protein AAC387_Pa06g0398 [Persea americana]